jgi:cytochrome P450
MTERPFTTNVDISSNEFWAKSFDEREKSFEWLRENAPISWHPVRETPDTPPEVHGEKGFWAVVRAEDVRHVSLHNDLFSSDLDTWGKNQFRPVNPALIGRPSFIEMDPPRHTSYRKTISSAFTPKAVAKLAEQIEERAEQIVSRVQGAGEIDFVEEVSSKLPMITIADMLGLDESRVPAFTDAANNLVGAFDPAVNNGEDPTTFSIRQRHTLRDIGIELIEDRRAHPRDDVATGLAQGEVDGHPLTDDDIMEMMMLLSVGGNDTTKNSTSHGVIQLWKRPDQLSWLREDYDGRILGAVDEFLRYATPIQDFARFVTKDLQWHGQQLTRGEKVVMFYCSANRDARSFPHPHRFDITRVRNNHVAFGGGGVHYCLGSGVAKAQLRALFRQFTTKLVDMKVGEPVFIASDFFHVVARLPVTIP